VLHININLALKLILKKQQEKGKQEKKIKKEQQSVCSHLYS
jgi:hypothetical protein